MDFVCFSNIWKALTFDKLTLCIHIHVVFQLNYSNNLHCLCFSRILADFYLFYFSNAFAVVNDDILLDELYFHGCYDNTYEWLYNYVHEQNCFY